MKILKLYNKLLKSFGSQHWWPAETAFEVVVGAVLTQRTSWNNVELSIENLKSAGMLEPGKINSSDADSLKKLIRPSGFYNQKSLRLKAVAEYIEKNGGMDGLAKKSTSELREELLSIKGIGRETADSILLYALGKPVFVIDAYTRRLFERLGMLDENKKADYDELRDFVEDQILRQIDDALGKNLIEIYKELHALIVRLGKDCCRTEPLCEKCPLKSCPMRNK